MPEAVISTSFFGVAARRPWIESDSVMLSNLCKALILFHGFELSTRW